MVQHDLLVHAMKVTVSKGPWLLYMFRGKRGVLLACVNAFGEIECMEGEGPRLNKAGAFQQPGIV